MAEIVAGSTATMAAARAWARARLYDDKLGEPDAPRLAAWAESIERWKLDAPDLIEGVIRHYEGQGAPTIQIGDLLHHAREVRRQRAEAEKAAEVHAAAGELPAGSGWAGLPIKSQGIPVWPAYEVNDAITRDCPSCHAEPNNACITGRDQPQKVPCLARLTGKPPRFGASTK
jgi:hypothetical protein